MEEGEISQAEWDDQGGAVALGAQARQAQDPEQQQGVEVEVGETRDRTVPERTEEGLSLARRELRTADLEARVPVSEQVAHAVGEDAELVARVAGHVPEGEPRVCPHQLHFHARLGKVLEAILDLLAVDEGLERRTPGLVGRVGVCEGAAQ